MTVLRPYRRILAGIFMLVYLLSATACREWLKLPVVVSHYLQHTATEAQTGFVDFLHDHYWHEESADTDSAEDARLPFHSSEYSNAYLFASTEPGTGLILMKQPESLFANNYPAINDADIPSGYQQGFWQPPRAA